MREAIDKVRTDEPRNATLLPLIDALTVDEADDQNIEMIGQPART